MSEIVPKDDPRARLARAEWLLNFGYDIAQVMSDRCWSVAMVDGYPEIVLSADGVRAMGMLSPNPRGSEIAEAIVRAPREGSSS